MSIRCLSVFCNVDAHVIICQMRMKWQVYLQQRWNRRRSFSFSSVSQKEVHTAVMVLSSTADLFFQLYSCSDGFICAPSLICFTHAWEWSAFLMFYWRVSGGFLSDLGFLCLSVSLCFACVFFSPWGIALLVVMLLVLRVLVWFWERRDTL